MVFKSLEERVKRLEEINEKQKLRIERIKAARACLNAIAKFEYYCEAGRWDEIPGLWAEKHPDVRSEICGWGVFEGTKGIRNLYPGIHKMDTKGPPGTTYRPGFCEIDIGTTHVLEVAGDGKTARLLFISPGVVSRGGHWMKLGVDFINEDGKWKLWHYHVYILFGISYYKSWAEPPSLVPPLAMPPSDRKNHPDLYPPSRATTPPDDMVEDRPTTHPLWWYRPDVVVDTVPAPPEPYETFNINMAY